MRAVVFANGEMGALAPIRGLIQPEDTIVSVDGGMRHLIALGFSPDIIIGDMDSIDPGRLTAMLAMDVEILQFPTEKDETDLELALDLLRNRGFKECIVVAALGGRTDQTLANIWLLAERNSDDFLISADDGCERVFVVLDDFVLRGTRGDTVSLIPYAAPVTGISTTGLQYPLANETLHPDKTRGLSNVLLADQAAIKIKTGKLLCVHRRESNCE